MHRLQLLTLGGDLDFFDDGHFGGNFAPTASFLYNSRLVYSIEVNF